MAANYPHKQTIIIGAVCIIAIAAVAFYVYGKNTSDSDLSIQPSINNENDTLSTSTDWRKDFFTSTTTAISKLASTSDQNGPLTLTAEMSRDFFSRYIQLKQSDLTNDDQSVQDAMNQTIAGAVISAPKPKIYSDINLKISMDNSPSSLHAYGNSVGAIIKTYIPIGDAALIATKALENGNMNLLSEIDPIILGYRNAVSNLLLIKVPSSAASQQLNLINSLNLLLYVSDGLRNVEVDPMQSMVALGLYADAHSSFVKAIVNMRNYLDTNNVSYSPSESGSIIYKITTQ